MTRLLLFVCVPLLLSACERNRFEYGQAYPSDREAATVSVECPPDKIDYNRAPNGGAPAGK
jgi:hypothetical protein